jgi:fumarylacetoacetase
MDFEVEMGVVMGTGNEMGHPIPVDEAHNHIFGYVLLNDWSARDLQTWEYIPLGPFTAKNFGSTISPWVVTPDALNPFKVKLPEQVPKPLSYLDGKNLYSYDVQIEVHVSGEGKKKAEDFSKISTSNYKYMYWTAEQQIAHHSVSGCKMNTGDILGSGILVF